MQTKGSFLLISKYFAKVALVLAIAEISFAAEIQPHRTGRFSVSLSERSPFSTLESFRERGYNFESKNDYVVQDEVANVAVPASYVKERPIGLIVWISAMDEGHIPGSFHQNLDEYGFMMVSVRQTGNRQSLFRRYGLALDTYHNLAKYYTIDHERVVISGISGGGRSASGISVVFPDVFKGGAYYVIGVDHWDRIYTKDRRFYKGFMESKPKRLEEAKSLRFVFHTGSEDFNKPGTQMVYQAYRKERFEHCLYLEDEGMAHTMPPRESIANGLAFLNAGLPEKGKQAVEEGLAQAHLGNFDAAWTLFQRADVYGNPDAATWIERMATAVERETSEAMSVKDAGGLLEMHRVLQQVVQKYGQEAAREASEKLQTLEQGPAFAREHTAKDILARIQQGHASAGIEQTVLFLKRLVEEYPDTSAASEAAGYLKNFEAAP